MNQNKVSKIVQSYYVFPLFVCEWVCLGWSSFLFPLLFFFSSTYYVGCVYVLEHMEKSAQMDCESETVLRNPSIATAHSILCICKCVCCYFLGLTANNNNHISFGTHTHTHNIYPMWTIFRSFSLSFSLFIHICRFIDMCETFHWVLVLIYSRFKFYGSKMIRWRNFLLSSSAVFASFGSISYERKILVIDFFEVCSRERKIKQKIIIKKAKLLQSKKHFGPLCHRISSLLACDQNATISNKMCLLRPLGHIHLFENKNFCCSISEYSVRFRCVSHPVSLSVASCLFRINGKTEKSTQ